MEKILIVVDKNLLTRIDEELARVGLGSNRSAFIRTACEKHLTFLRGVQNSIRKKELSREFGNESV